MNRFTKETKMNVAKRTALSLLGLLFLACSGAPAPAPASQPEELDVAIRETSDYLNNQLPKGNKLVILNIHSEFPALSEYIIDELIANTVNDRIFSVVDRQQLDTIRAELDFQTSGEVDDETAQALGRLAGAQSIVSGAVSRIGDLYRLRVRVLSVQTAQIEGQFNRNIPEGSTIAALVKSQATGYGGGSVAARTQQDAVLAAAPAIPGAQTPADPAPVQGYSIEATTMFGGRLLIQGKEPLNIGDNETATIPIDNPGTYSLRMVYGDGLVATKSARVTSRGITKVNFTYYVRSQGPSGGYVFFDKGDNSNGWQFLEAVPANIEFKSKWDDAFPQVDALVVNDLFGWRLPDKDELNLMYVNLKEKGLGGFANDVYWSSTELDGGYGVWTQNFRDGSPWANTIGPSGSTKDRTWSVRAIRAF